MTSSSARILLELESGDPVAGRVVDGLGDRRAFYGWTALFAVLREVAADLTTEAPPQGPPKEPTS